MTNLINISEATSIAIHSLAMIAGSKEFLTVSKMAERLNFSKNHMSKIMQVLARMRYVESVRGPKGGFRLVLPPGEISLLEIVELFDGKIAPESCGIHRGKCPFRECVWGGFTSKVTQEFRNYYGTRTLSDIIVQKNEKTDHKN